MNREEIKTFLPHREPMLLIDEVKMIDNVAYATYKVRGDEFFLQGHFPGNPIVPGVIQCEIMAQGSCILIKNELKGKTPLYRGLNNIKFKRQVKPGETINVKAHITQRRGLFFIVEAEASVEGQLCVCGTLTFALIENNK